MWRKGNPWGNELGFQRKGKVEKRKGSLGFVEMICVREVRKSFK